MIKKILFLNLFILSILLFSCSSKKENNESEEEKINIDESMNFYIENFIEHTPTYNPAWNQESFKNRWNYIDGVFLKSMIDLYKKTNDNKYMDFVVNYTDYYIDSDGKFVCPDDENINQTPFLENELDSICESRILFDLYDYTNDSRYLNAINYTYEKLMNMNTVSNGYNYWHKDTYVNQIWLDGMYMYVPFYARKCLLDNNMDGFDILKIQYEFMREKLYNSDKGLYYHAYDDSETKIFWAVENNGPSISFWLRGMGWYITSLADLLEYVPENNPNREFFINLFKEAINGILKYKDNDTNMFYQVVDRGGEGETVQPFYLKNLAKINEAMYIENYLESSGSSLIAYSILKGANLNILDDDYKKIGKDIFEGTFYHSFRNNKLNDICITAGLGPENRTYRDGTFSYYLAEPVGSNDAKGVGPFIMAYLAS